MGSRKITKEQEKEIALLYRQDREAAAARCVALGLNPMYAASVASLHGVRRMVGGGHGAPPKPSKSTISTNTFNDPRWERAKKIGAVVA